MVKINVKLQGIHGCLDGRKDDQRYRRWLDDREAVMIGWLDCKEQKMVGWKGGWLVGQMIR